MSFPRDTPTARASSQAPVAVKVETPIVAKGDAQTGDDDDTMGADYDVEPDADDTLASRTAVVEDDGPDSSSLIHM